MQKLKGTVRDQRLSFVVIVGLMLMLTAYRGGDSADSSVTTVALEGDATRGAELFTQSVNGAPACSTCHTTNNTVVVGPGFQGYSEVAATRAIGKSAEEYTHNSIVRPASYIVSGFSNSMYNLYERALSDQDIADLTAYLLTL
jgi:cytochrome c553